MDFIPDFDCLLKRALAGRRLAVSLFYANLLWCNVTYSQRSALSFGGCTDRALGFTPQGLSIVQAAPGARAQVVLLSTAPPAVHFLTVDSTGAAADSTGFALPAPQMPIGEVEAGRDGRPEYVLLAPESGTVSLLTFDGQSHALHVVATGTRAQRAAIADINNDGRRDILLFGKTTAGVVTLLGQPGGRFIPGPVLFPEISASDLKTIDLNGDGITDVILLNWLSNEMVLFYGISKTIFSEQVTISLPGEPADLAVTELTRDRTLRAAVTLPDQQRIVCLTGNSAGEFQIVASMHTPGGLYRVRLADVNHDALPDVVAGTSKGIFVALARSPRAFAPPALFGGADAVAPLWDVGDVDGDQMADLVTADRTRRRLTITSNANAAIARRTGSYTVGSYPQGIYLGDFNGDGRLDIAVANTVSSTLSLLLNRGNGLFDGQVSIDLSERPVSVIGMPSRSNQGHLLIASHPGAERISVINLSPNPSQSTSFAMPTGAHPYVLLAHDSPRARKLEILVRYGNSRDASLSLSLFEQLSGKMFLERNLRASVPNKIMALTVADVAGKGAYDLLVASHDRSTRMSSVSLATSTGSFDFTSTRTLFSFPDSTASTRSVICAQTRAEGRKDIFVFLGPPRNAVAVARGSGAGVFSDSLEWLTGVQPLNDDAIVLRDVDGDGAGDLALLDAGKNALVVCYQDRGGRFGAPSVICPADGVSGFAIGPLVDPLRQDLVLAHGNAGTLSIMFNPFAR